MKFHIMKSTDVDFNNYKEDLYNLRHKVFKEKLNWKVDSNGAQEKDIFDNLPDVFFVMVMDSNNKVVGCIRLLPTLNEYMLETIFPIILQEHNIPKLPNVWELSRFAIDPDYQKHGNNFSFNQITLLLIKGIFLFAQQNNITSYIAVTTASMYRIVKKINIDTVILGKTIFIDNTNVIAMEVFINNKGFKAIETEFKKIENLKKLENTN
jgi:acyl homoserine lactone synthase